VCVVAEIDQTNLIQDKMRLVAQAWGVDLAALERRLRFGSGDALSAQRLLRVLEGDTGHEPFALIIIDQLGVLEGPREFEQFRQLTHIKHRPVAVAVGHDPLRRINHPIVVDELKH
jgi:hypothetical protein